jgi:hypothetical protein
MEVLFPGHISILARTCLAKGKAGAGDPGGQMPPTTRFTCAPR